MALVLSPSPPPSMTTSILLRSPSPSPSPASIPLPALQTDLSSSSSSSASGSCLDLHHSSAPPTRRIRFAPLPDPRRDLLDLPSDDPQPESKQPLSAPNDPPDGFVALSPTVSLDSTLSSAHSTPTIRVSPYDSQKSDMKLLRPFASLLRSRSSSPSQSPASQSSSLSGSRDSLRSSSSLPGSPCFNSARLPRFATEDILTLGTKALFRTRTESSGSTRSLRPTSPPPKLDSSRFLHRSSSTGSGPGLTLDARIRDVGGGSSQSHDTAGSGQKKRRSSSISTPGAGGGRHACSVKSPSDQRPSTAPSSPLARPKKHVKMLNGRIYGAKRYAAQTLANPFANVREEPEFVEWGYGGMGSVNASAGIANDMWKGLQRSERGGALLAGSSFGSPSEADPTAGVINTSGNLARATSPNARRKASHNVPECSMGSVGPSGGTDEDDGSGMGWVKRRRAEREAKARLEQQAKQQPQEGRKSSDSMDPSIMVSSASTSTSLTACTSTASTGFTTPATSPHVSRSPSLADLNSISSPVEDLGAAPSAATGEQSKKSDTPAHPASTSKDEHEHHVLTAVRLSPNISNKHGHSVTPGRTPSLSHTLLHVGNDTDNENSKQNVPLSPVDTEETSTSTNSSNEDGEEPNRASDEGEEPDDADDADDDSDEGIQDIGRKTALGAGVEKVSRHVDAEAR